VEEREEDAGEQSKTRSDKARRGTVGRIVRVPSRRDGRTHSSNIDTTKIIKQPKNGQDTLFIVSVSYQMVQIKIEYAV